MGLHQEISTERAKTMYVVNFRDRFNSKQSIEVSDKETACLIFNNLLSDSSIVSAVVISPDGSIIKYFAG